MRCPQCIVYIFLLGVNTYICNGSIGLILRQVSLPTNLEVAIVEDNTNAASSNNVRDLISARVLDPKTLISSPNFKLLKVKNPMEQDVQILYIFLHPNPNAFYSSLDKFKNICGKQNSNINWDPMCILIWPSNCSSKTNKSMRFEENFTINKMIEFAQQNSLKSDVYILNYPCAYGGNPSASEIELWEFYSIGNIQNHHKFHFELNTPDNPWHILGNKLSRRKNFEGAIISATASDDKDYQEESKFSESAPRFEGGSSVQRYWFLRDGLNFTEFAVADEWTSEDENGMLTGGAVRVANGEVDISISQSAMTPFKANHIDFLQPTDESNLKAFFIQPPASKYRDIFISPFQADLWSAMFATWILIMISLQVFTWVQSQMFEQLNQDDSDIASDSWIWAVGTACQQGWHTQPVSLSIRITFALGHLTGLVCFAAYSASIVSFLSLKTLPMKTFGDILDSSFRIFANENSTPIAFVLPELKMQAGFPSKVLVPESISIPTIMNSRSAVITYDDVFSIEARLLNYTDKDLCDRVDSVQINLVALRSGMIVKKESPYREFFNYQIMVMMEGGLNYRYLRSYNGGTETRCLRVATGHKQALGILDVLTAGIILMIGYMLSFIILGFEILIAAKNGRSGRQIPLLQ